MTVDSTIIEMAQAAKAATFEMARCSSRRKNRVLRAIADAVESEHAQIKAENARDLEYGREKGLSAAMLFGYLPFALACQIGLQEVLMVEHVPWQIAGCWIAQTFVVRVPFTSFAKKPPKANMAYRALT